MTDAGVNGIADVLEETWSNLLRAVEEIDEALFQWSPGPEFNSIAILLRHLAGSERWWIGEAIGDVPSNRERKTEFAHNTPSRADILRAVEESRAITRRVLQNLTMQDLQAETTPTVTRGKPPVRPTKLWALLHCLEHLGYHSGQVLMLRNLGRKMPSAAAR